MATPGDSETHSGWDWRHASADGARLEILPHGSARLMPLALGGLVMAGGVLATCVPGIPMVVRLAAWVAIIAIGTEAYRTHVRRLVVSDDAVDIELARTRTRIPYARLDHVIVRPQRTSLGVTFVVRHPSAVIRTRIALTSADVREIAPRLIRALSIHGVDVQVPGRPDLGTTS